MDNTKMAEMKSPGNVKKAKIRTPVAEIIVGGFGGKDYYNILYLDPSGGKLHIGFGSSNLDFVRKWLEEEFEVDESIESDFTNVVRCKDCKRSYEDISGRTCAYGAFDSRIVPDDFFCSYGERKEGAKNG